MKKWLKSPQLYRLLLAFAPALMCGILIAGNAVNVPVWEDWKRGELLERQAQEKLSAADLLATETGAGRPMVPRVLMLAFNGISGGDLRWEIALAFAALCATAGGLYFLLTRTLPEGRWRLLAALAISLALFMPLQYPNMLWAARLGFVLSISCLALALAALSTRWPPGARAALAALLALIGMHSHPLGILIWPAVLSVALFGGARFHSGARTALVIGSVPWLLLAAAQLARGGVAWSSGTAEVLATLGSPIARALSNDARVVAPLIGAILLAVYLASFVLLLRHRSESETRETLLPWLALGGSAIAGSFVLGLTAETSLQPRHISASILLPISLIATAGFWLRRWMRAAPAATESGDPLAARSAITAVAAGVVLAVWLPGWADGKRRMEQWKSARLQARVMLMYLPYQEPHHHRRIDGDLERVKRHAALLGHPGLEEFGFGPFRPDEKRMGKSDRVHATIRQAKLEDGLLFVRGHAALPDSGRAADGILLTWRIDKDDEWNALVLAEPIGQSVPEMAFRDLTFGRGPNLTHPRQFSKWFAETTWPDHPQGTFMLRAWALDSLRMRAYPLGGEVKLNGKPAAGANTGGGAS